jgi:upstream activation factor subunit UAF30
MAKKETSKETASKTEGKKATGTKTASAAKGAAKTGGSANSAFMAPVNIGEALHPIVGKDPIPRTEVTKKIWEYIKKNNLQDPNAKRTIIADEKLQKVFGGKKSVDMFEMTKLVNQHLKK